MVLSASAKAIRVAMHFPNPLISYINLHKMAKRATPIMFRKNKLSHSLFKHFNGEIPEKGLVFL
jgi:hypothetical protein